MPSLGARLRSLGVGVARGVTIATRDGFPVVTASSHIDKGTILAAIPETATLCAVCLPDNDRNGFFPPFEDFVQCALDGVGPSRTAQSTGTKRQVETLALAHYLSLMVHLETSSWFAGLVSRAGTLSSSSAAEDDGTVSRVHSRLSRSFVTAPLRDVAMAAEYVATCAVMRRASPSPNLTRTTGENQAEGCLVHLVPFADLLVAAAKRELTPPPPSPLISSPVSLQRWTAANLRDHLRLGAAAATPRSGLNALRGARQHLATKHDDMSYFALVANESFSPADVITMTVATMPD